MTALIRTTITIFIILVLLIVYLKPAGWFLIDKQSKTIRLKPFGLNQDETLLPLSIFLPLLAIVLYGVNILLFSLFR